MIPFDTSAPPLFAAVCLALVATSPLDAIAEPPGDSKETDADAESNELSNTGDAGADSAGPLEQRERAPDSNIGQKKLASLRSSIDRTLSNQVESEAEVGILVADTTTGQVLYRRNPERTFNPASNMKLWTAAAALDRFGPAKTFETELLAPTRNGETVSEGLYLRGEGDAFLLFEDVVNWAAELKLKGVERVEGGIVIDDTIFDDAYLPPAYDQKDEDDSYRAPIGAVSINFNAVTAIASPGDSRGAPPDMRSFPPNDYVRYDVRAKTVSGDDRDLVFKSEPTDDGATEIIVEGAIGLDAPEMRSRLRIDHPPAFAGSILKHALSMVGIEVSGDIRTGETPDGAEVLVAHQSQPLSYLLLAMNKWSNNFMAEQLLRRLGAEGDTPSTWKRARGRLRSFAESIEVPTDDLRLKNGSGLYSGNAVAPSHFVRLLTAMLDHRAAPEFLSSLAIAGTDGTLAHRMQTSTLLGNLRGKTGTLAHVSALSGYLRTASNRLLAFSMLFNETPRKGWRYRSVQDDIAELLASFDG